MTSAPKPWSHEPYCIHASHSQIQQPASACAICQDGDELHKWVAAWDAWLAENPDSPEAHWRRRHP